MSRRIITSITILILSTDPTKIHAQPIEGIGTITPPANIPRSPDSISGYIPTIIDASFLIGIIATLIYIVYGGIRWIMSGGDQKALAAARETIIQAIVGFILLSVGFAVAKLLEKVLGIN